VADPRGRDEPDQPDQADKAVLRVSRTCAIPLQELEWRFSASGGPGGQHANTANTRVEVRFDVASSPSLGPRQRARLVERLGAAVRVVASDERSQARNRQLALDRLRSRLAEALRVAPARHPTSPTRQARERRLEDKRRRGDIKRQRRLGAVREQGDDA
jgi:ribosome-associated protein